MNIPENKCKRPFLYELVDFYLVAFLLCREAMVYRDNSDDLICVKLEGKIKEVKNHKEKKGTRIFVVETVCEIDEINRHYYNNNVLVSPKELSQNIRDLKSIIYQFREKNKT